MIYIFTLLYSLISWFQASESSDVIHSQREKLISAKTWLYTSITLYFLSFTLVLSTPVYEKDLGGWVVFFAFDIQTGLGEYLCIKLIFIMVLENLEHRSSVVIIIRLYQYNSVRLIMHIYIFAERYEDKEAQMRIWRNKGSDAETQQ